MNRSFRLIILIMFLLIIAYFSFVIAGGGFGKKPFNNIKIILYNSPFFFAHRGVADEFPENSRDAIRKAKICSLMKLEIDIRKSSDNEFILFNNPAINTALESFNTGKIWTWQLMPKNLVVDYFNSLKVQ